MSFFADCPSPGILYAILGSLGVALVAGAGFYVVRGSHALPHRAQTKKRGLTAQLGLVWLKHILKENGASSR